MYGCPLSTYPQWLEEESDEEVCEPVGDDRDGGGRGAPGLRKQLGHEEPAVRSDVTCGLWKT